MTKWTTVYQGNLGNQGEGHSTNDHSNTTEQHFWLWQNGEQKKSIYFSIDEMNDFHKDIDTSSIRFEVGVVSIWQSENSSPT